MLKLLKPAPASRARRARASAPAAAASRSPTPTPLPVARPAAAAQRPSIALVKAHSLPALVQRELEAMILHGELPPGTKLNEVALAERLGVSRGPVREAFRALEESGLVRLEKNRGVRVRHIPVEEADEIYEVRALLDAFVAERVAATATPEAIRELREHVARMERAAARNDVDVFFAANLAFHDRLVELAGNAKLLTTYRRLVNELRLFRRTTLAQEGALPTSAREHRAIVDRIATGDGAGAARALHEHVMSSRERMHRTNDGAPRSTRNARKAR